MALSDYTLRIIHDLKTGATQFGNGTVDGTVKTEVNKFPDVLMYGVSLAVTFKIWQDQTNSEAFEFNPSTCTLYGRPQSSGLDSVQLGQTAVSGAAEEVTITVAKDLIPSSWASFDNVALILDIDGTLRTKVTQGIRVIAPDLATADGGTTSADFGIDSPTLTAETTLTNVAGWRTYFLDSTAGAFTVHLPTPGSNAGQKIEFLHVAGANDVDIDPGIYELGGATGDVPMQLDDRLDLREYVPAVGTAAWFNFKVKQLS